MKRLHAMALALAGGMLMLAALSAWGASGDRRHYVPGKLNFSVRVDGVVSNYEVLGLFVMPGESVSLTLMPPDPDQRFDVRTSAGTPKWLDTRTVSWRAPARPGDHQITVTPRDGGPSMQLNVFVLVPAKAVKDGRLNGYRIGAYPATALKGLEIYRPPRGYIEVTPENVGVRVAPHFTLGQFLSKQRGGYPKYLVLRERLLIKLELILEQLNAAGVRTNELVIMSGYRTPYYNHAIGNVKYSRHQWGGAADIYVDVAPRDGRMDDLNGDGKLDVWDADWLYRLVDGLYGQPFYTKLVGGLGRYKATAAHGGFVHVDVRGTRSRWGL